MKRVEALMEQVIATREIPSVSVDIRVDGAERFHLTLEASPLGGSIDPVEGHFPLPEGPGLGVDPDPDVIKTYTVPAD